MATADLIQELNNDLNAAYAKIEEKGGTVPAEKNTNNLAEAIATVQGGGITPRPPLPEYPYPVEEFDGGEWGAIAYLRDDTVHYYTATSENDINIYNTGASNAFTLKTLSDGFNVTNLNVLAYAVGSSQTEIKHLCLANCSLLQSFYWNKSNATTSIGNYFLYNCINYNYPMDVPNEVTSIGSRFLGGCKRFNQPLTLPTALSAINSEFLVGCNAFNQPLLLPKNLQSIDAYFMQNCTAFNQPLEIPNGISAISDYFLNGCSSFDNTFNLPDGLVRIGVSFMRDCAQFNQPLVLPDSLSIISNAGINTSAFMYNCSSFNQPIQLPASMLGTPSYFLSSCTAFNSEITFRGAITAIGDYFLYYCSAFNQPVNLPSSVSRIGARFLSSCTSFNQPVTLPEGLSIIGDYFLSYCSVFNQTIILPNSLKTIGSYFLAQSPRYTKPLALPSSLTSIGNYFIHIVQDFTGPLDVGSLPASIAVSSTGSLATNTPVADCYAIGITITGANAQEWKDRFPDRTANPFRKLIVKGPGPELNGGLYGVVKYLRDGQTLIYTATSANDLAIANSSTAYTIKTLDDGFAITNSNIVAYATGSEMTSLDSYTLANCPLLEQFCWNKDNHITAIGNRFLHNSTAYNYPMEIPDGVTSIGTYFMSSCTSFNQPITLPSGTKSLPYFLFNCTSFSQPVTLPSTVTDVDYFLANCTNFNSTVTAPGLTRTGVYYMANNQALVDHIVLPEAATRIDSYFMYNSESLKTATIPDRITTVSEGFLYNCPNLESLTVETQARPSETGTLGTTNAVARSYTMGVELSGAGAETWASTLIYRSSNPYRRVYTSTDPVYLLYTTQTGVEYKLTGRNDKSAFLDTWCYIGNSSAAEVHYQPEVETLTEVTALPLTVPTTVTRGFLSSCPTAAVDGLEHFTHLTTINNRFLVDHTSFNGTLPDLSKVEVINDSFMRGCKSFNQPLSLPAVTSIGDDFLQGCSSYNQPLSLPDTVTSIGSYFLYGCTPFNQPLSLPAVTSIGHHFLWSCTSFNQPLSLPEVTDIGDYFLWGCSSFNQPLSLPSATNIGADFMRECPSFNEELSLPVAISIGAYFLYSCSSFNQPLSLPDTLEVTDVTQWFTSCDSFVGPLNVGGGIATFPSNNYALITTNASAPMYVTGVTLTGANAQYWKDTLPNKTSSPYRKLIVATS